MRHGHYGLMSSKAKSPMSGPIVGGLVVGAVALGSLFAVCVSSSPAAIPQRFVGVNTVAVATDDAPPADLCPTKPFAQCAGMNFTKPDSGTGFNFTASAKAFACSPRWHHPDEATCWCDCLSGERNHSSQPFHDWVFLRGLWRSRGTRRRRVYPDTHAEGTVRLAVCRLAEWL